MSLEFLIVFDFDNVNKFFDESRRVFTQQQNDVLEAQLLLAERKNTKKYVKHVVVVDWHLGDDVGVAVYDCRVVEIDFGRLDKLVLLFAQPYFFVIQIECVVRDKLAGIHLFPNDARKVVFVAVNLVMLQPLRHLLLKDRAHRVVR